jgi:hypothetical protein
MSEATVTLLIQIIGVLGVIGSLIFVGIQVRQNSVAVRAASNSTVAEAFRELNLVMASNKDLARVLATSQQDPTALDLTDKVVVFALWRAVFHCWSNAHRQHLNGTLDPALWQSVAQEISVIGKSPVLARSINVSINWTAGVAWRDGHGKASASSSVRIFRPISTTCSASTVDPEGALTP